MASAFSHAVVALSIGPAVLLRRSSMRIWLLGAACAILPDLDVIGFWWGVPYGHLFGHRGLTHSLPFAASLSSMLVMVAFRDEAWRAARPRLLLYFFLATASHGFLDAFTRGGLGIAFFAPFDNTRYLFPFQPIPAAPLSIGGFFTELGLRILASEIVWFWIPSLAFAALVGWGRGSTETSSRA